MGKLLRKVAYNVFILFSVATVVFFLFSFSFPSLEDILATDRTDQKTIDAIRTELKLDQPLHIQYFSFLHDLSPVSWYSEERTQETNALVLFDGSQKNLVLKFPYLRRSFQSGQPTSTLLFRAFKTTMFLALIAMVLASIAGIFFGIIMALKRGTLIDQFLLGLSTLGISVPSFFSAILLSWLFGYVLSDLTGLDVVGSLYDVDPETGRYIRWRNAILPAIALGVRPLSIISQLTRNSMLDSMKQEYITTARSKGLSEFRIVVFHALRSALNPVITSISGWFASLLAGAFFVEYIFSWKGIGSLSIQALETSDLPVIMGSVLFIATVFIVVNALVDYIYTLLDPRVKGL